MSPTVESHRHRRAPSLWLVLGAFFCLAIGLVVADAVFMYRPMHDHRQSVCNSLRDAFESGGPQSLRFATRAADAGPGAIVHLVDPSGRDLATDRQWTPPAQSQPGRLAADYGKYACVAEMPANRPAPFGPMSWVPLFVSVLCCSFGLYVTWRMRRIEAVMRHFGAGELAARMPTDSRDAIGRLAATFNQMADRIQSLMDQQRQLCADVAHELRSPLTRLLLSVPGARRGSNVAIDRIEQEAERVNDLLDQLLTVARAEADHILLEAVDVQSLLADVADYCAIEASAHACEIEMEVLPGAGSVMGDPELLRRAVENVVRNALRHTPVGTRVRLSAGSAGEHAIIAVRDYGLGVAVGSLHEIFQPFYRAERNTRGTGLGLAIAQRAIALHHGDIRAENCDPGLRVTIWLPRAKRAA